MGFYPQMSPIYTDEDGALSADYQLSPLPLQRRAHDHFIDGRHASPHLEPSIFS